MNTEEDEKKHASSEAEIFEIIKDEEETSTREEDRHQEVAMTSHYYFCYCAKENLINIVVTYLLVGPKTEGFLKLETEAFLQVKSKRPEVFEGRSGSVQVVSNGQGINC